MATTDNPATPINDTASLQGVLFALHDHLATQGELLKRLSGQHGAQALVDVRRSVASGTTLTLPLVSNVLTEVRAIVYSVASAATLVIGDRSIPLPVGAGTLQAIGMLIYPEDAITLTVAVAGALYLEITGRQVPPGEALRVIR